MMESFKFLGRIRMEKEERRKKEIGMEKES